jgi:hypothetical protein
MAEFRRQHYLPAVYLKQFSIDGPTATRKSNIWRYDRKALNYVTVETQCREPYFYSKPRASEVEQMFGKVEGIYGNIAQKIWRCEQSKSLEDYFGLIIFMVDLHVRNPAYANATGGEQIDAYECAVAAWRDHLLCLNERASDAECVEMLKNRWGVRIIEAVDGAQLVTSDNPCIWAAGQGQNRMTMMLMPVTPTQLAIAFDREVHSITKPTMTLEDQVMLNFGQCNQSIEAIYTHFQPTDTDKDNLNHALNNQSFRDGSIGRNEWRMNVFKMPKPLSFLAG